MRELRFTEASNTFNFLYKLKRHIFKVKQNSKMKLIDSDLAIKVLPQNKFLGQFYGILSTYYAEVSDEWEYNEGVARPIPRFKRRENRNSIYIIEKNAERWFEDLLSEQEICDRKGNKYASHEATRLQDEYYGKGFQQGYYEFLSRIEKITSSKDKVLITNECFKAYMFTSCIYTNVDSGRKSFRGEIFKEQGYKDGRRYAAWTKVLDSPDDYQAYDNQAKIMGIILRYGDEKDEIKAVPFKKEEDKINPITIFSEINHFYWFKRILKEHNLIGVDGFEKKKGIQVATNSIYRSDKIRKEDKGYKTIFKHTVTQSSLIIFLRSEFHAKIKSNIELTNPNEKWLDIADEELEKYQEEVQQNEASEGVE